MGVKLTELLPRKQIEFDSLANKTIAIDASNMLYQFLSSIRQPDGTPLMDSKRRITSHLVGTFSRLSNLMERGIKVCVVLDGKPPILKIKEIEERELKKQLAAEKLSKAMEEENIKDVYKYSKQTIRLTPQVVLEAKELMLAMGIPVIQAPSEAEAQAAFMCEKGDVYAVASSDQDCLLFGAPRQITNLTLSQRKKLPSGGTVKTNPELIELKEVLNSLGINQDQLIVLAILIGTDFNEGIHRVGPKTALKLVKQYKDFDKLFKEVKAEFNWKQVYAVFKSMPIMKNYQLKWKEPDVDKIKKLLVKEHDFSEERVDKTLEKITKKKPGQKGLGQFF
ncbi:MAG: flap endonuclease-1 [Candidatus Woesearchaeota archaeon]|nr:MAG: flap endonuclease-1 [Candidatus Woesearchaeota archaeon]